MLRVAREEMLRYERELAGLHLFSIAACFSLGFYGFLQEAFQTPTQTPTERRQRVDDYVRQVRVVYPEARATAALMYFASDILWKDSTAVRYKEVWYQKYFNESSRELLQWIEEQKV